MRVGVAGASGYSGAELVRLLAAHPGAVLAKLAAGEQAGQPIDKVFPSLRGVSSQQLDETDWGALGEACDVVFLALPHGHALDAVPQLLASGCRVVDLGADFRLRDPAAYREHYGHDHRAPELLAEAVYGLPERHRDEIAGARLIANPGCYPTATALALLPLLPLLRRQPAPLVVVDAKSGVSGAGRKATTGVHFCEVSDSLKPYSPLAHRHQPEIEQLLGEALATPQPVAFVPHLVPMTRGILSCCYLQPAGEGPLSELDQEEADALYGSAYEAEPFVRVLPAPELPATKNTLGSNLCDVAVRVDRQRRLVVAFAAIDNLVKGAAGQAVQNFNLMFGFEETTGLRSAPLFP
ncbi:MAG: N-acetyl-gamma-glutamyl-phosphate reductase [Acidobacteria bacterium]|nr:MAG: N-acetyl-gamma-glutamyl-phosphate reductase [Acidobacteriota bacterium]REK05611.1 MAG: N-acetyl-gamma-glutamyl-phosphate reductase [Acidobacteriota bacterium]